MHIGLYLRLVWKKIKITIGIFFRNPGTAERSGTGGRQGL